MKKFGIYMIVEGDNLINEMFKIAEGETDKDIVGMSFELKDFDYKSSIIIKSPQGKTITIYAKIEKDDALQTN